MALAGIIIAIMIVGLVLLQRKAIYKIVKDRRIMYKLPALSKVAYPLIGHTYLLAGTPEQFFHSARTLVGDFYQKTKEKICILWLGPVPLLFLIHPESVEVILRSSKHTKKSFVYWFLEPWLGTGLLTSHGEKWKQRRRLITPSFHFNILQDFLDVMNDQSQIFVENLKKEVHSKKSVDVGTAITMCALDIICETAMGQTVNAQEDLDSDYVKALHKLSDIIQLRQKTPYLWWDYSFKKMKVGNDHDQALKTLHSFTKEVIQERMKTKDSVEKARRMAFLDVLLHARTEDGKELTLNDIQEEVDTFMFEGHDTTAAAMTWATFLVGSDPDVQRRVHEELDEVFGGDRIRPITMDDLRKLQYLERVIKESLRIFPSVPFMARVTTEDCEISGHRVPKGTQVATFVHFVHHNPDVWPEPEKFDPDRFTPENSSSRHPYAYIPFSAGPRNCIGQRFALQEEKVMMASLLRNFTVTSHDKREDLEMVADLILRPSKPLNITLEERS